MFLFNDGSCLIVHQIRHNLFANFNQLIPHMFTRKKTKFCLSASSGICRFWEFAPGWLSQVRHS
jgi:hypothetical protein